VDATIDYINLSQELYKKAGDKYGEANALLTLGDALKQKKQIDAAESTFKRALALHKESSDFHGEAEALVCLAKLCKEGDRIEEATTYVNEANSLFHKIAGPLTRDWVKFGVSLGNVYDDLGNSEKVISVIKRSPLKGQDTDQFDQLVKADGFLTLAFAYWQLDCLNDAVECYQRTLAIFQQLNQPRGEAFIHKCLAFVYIEKGCSDLSAAHRASQSKASILAELHDVLRDLGEGGDDRSMAHQQRAAVLTELRNSIGKTTIGA
jgi:tetratricopeptide (TPR) repeat protein